MSDTTLTLPSPGKLNLFLHITGRRANGYHELQTLFQFFDYGDTLHFTPNNDGQIRLTCDVPELAGDDNLIMRAARLLQQQYTPSSGVDIHLDKVLPMGGGVGGGSSNAATTLLALNHLWQLDLSHETLCDHGLGLGADVPVFVAGKATFAEGVGELFSPAHPQEHWYLVAKPDCHVATGAVFTHPDLPRNTPVISSSGYTFEGTHNDCEALVKKQHPEVANTIERLLEYAPTRLTGTGACVFCPFDTQQAASRALQYLLGGSDEGVSGFVAKGMNISSTHLALDKVRDA